MMSDSKHPPLFILTLLLVLAGAQRIRCLGADDEAAAPPIVGVVPIGQQAMEPRDAASETRRAASPRRQLRDPGYRPVGHAGGPEFHGFRPNLRPPGAGRAWTGA